ncbi:FAD-binding oxidoreductase [Streptomyces capparidis]
MDALRATSAHEGNPREEKERTGAPSPQGMPRSRPPEPNAAARQGTGRHGGAPAPEAAAGQGDGGWSWFAPRRRSEQDEPGDHQPADGSAPDRPVEHPAPGRPAPGSPAPQAPAPDRPEQDRPAGPGPAPHRPLPLSAPLDGEPASPDAILIRRTMEAVKPASDKVISYFYATLFLHNPEVRELFPAAMDHQRDRLMRALLIAAKHIDDTEFLTQYLSNLGRGHRKYGTVPEHYPAVGEALITALARYAGETWTEEVEAAWVRAYTTISQIMIDAAADDELRSPPWWQAEIVSHELRTPDIAVITVRPDQPYPFLAGQYTTLETPWWPRVWRHYSFASAPSPDGLLSFHVKAVPAGWVSTALVHRARAGDVIRLGPPAGSMVVDHTSDNGLLCLGGGTGIAPIKALVEDVAGAGRRRKVEVFYGARSDDDLYDLDTLVQLARRHSWLGVHPVVDGRDVIGPLPDVVRKYGPWHAFDAYLSGPPGMIRRGVDTLTGIGIPTHRIRHDFVGDLVTAD